MYLERDFSGDLFAQYSRIVGTNNLLSLEKATSHATTGDDAISIEIFTKPKKIIQERYKNLKLKEIPRWLLLRNYTNNQIAKLFTRVFRESTGDNYEDRVPRPYIACTSVNQVYNESSQDLLTDRSWLYFSEENNGLTDSLFNEGIKNFSQLGIYGNADTRIDGRFALLRKIMYIDCEDVKAAEFIQSKIGTVYNAEYFRCIVTDILLSALKYCSDKPDFLLRVDGMLEKRYFMKKKVAELRKEPYSCSDSQSVEERLLTGWYYTEVERIGFQLSETYKNKELPCMVKITREKCNDKVDYLVFKNPVDSVYNETFNWKYINNMIACKLRDPLDFPD